MPLLNPFKSGLPQLHAQKRVERLLLGHGTGPRVLILPGLPGSQIGRRDIEVIWFNVVNIIQGKLADLSLDLQPNQQEALGVLLSFYAPTAVALVKAAFNVDFYPFDWRKGIDELGAELKQHLEGENAAEVNLVAHSMGGLVARSAIAQGAPKVKRLIMVGTPNCGLLIPVQVLRSTNPLVRALAVLDVPHTAEDLAFVFSSFPAFYHLLPSTPKFHDLLTPNGWPKQGPGPRPDILATASKVHNLLKGASGDSRFVMIAGINQRTAVDAQVVGDEFQYKFSTDGDGLVPTELALLPGVKTYYVEEHHTFLMDNPEVANAIVDLLQNDRTVLHEQKPPLLPGSGTFTDSKLASLEGAAHELGALALGEVRNILSLWDTVPPEIN